MNQQQAKELMKKVEEGQATPQEKLLLLQSVNTSLDTWKNLIKDVKEIATKQPA